MYVSVCGWSVKLRKIAKNDDIRAGDVAPYNLIVTKKFHIRNAFPPLHIPIWQDRVVSSAFVSLLMPQITPCWDEGVFLACVGSFDPM